MARRKRRKPGPARVPKDDDSDVANLVAELQAQSVELEAQNEALRDAHRNLELSRDRYAELFDLAPIAYVSVDEKGIILDLNFVAASMLGSPRSNLVGFPLVNFVDDEHRGLFWLHLSKCRNGVSQLKSDLNLKIKDRVHATHEVIPVQLLTAPSLGSERPTGFRTAILDLRDRRLAEQRAAELIRETALREDADRSNRAKDEFMALLAHELRTPLNVIHGWTYLLGSGGLGASEQARAIEVISRNVKLQTVLIDDMLDMSRIVRGAVELNVAPVDLAEMVRTAVDGIRPVATEKEIAIDCATDPIASHTSGDIERLGQVLSSLLSNAVKFTPGGGRIVVRLTRGLWRSSRIAARTREHWHECARITVSDTGRGIHADELERVFERFWRGRNARQIGGLGLGLSIARRLVEMHDGDIWAESAGEGSGATFVVELPLETAPARRAHAVARDGAAPPRGLTGVRVLLVDDDPEARDIVARELQPFGADVTAVASAREAYEAIQRLRPHLLLSDLAMPEEDGVSLIQRIRKLPSELGGVTPAVALTAWAGAGDERRLLEAGFQKFVAKPIDADRLGELIAEVLSEARDEAS